MSISMRLLPAVAAVVAMLGFAPAKADGLDAIMAAKVIKVAVPQDFAPFGFVGKDLKPQGYDIDMANLIAKELGVKDEIIPVTSANRIPTCRPRRPTSSSQASARMRAGEGDRFPDAYAPFFSGVFGTKDIAVKSPADLKGKTVGATRGAIEEQELSKTAPAEATIKRFEDNTPPSPPHLGPGRPDRDRQYGCSDGRRAFAGARAGAQVRDQDSPCYVGLNKDEPKLMAKLNEIIAKAKKSGELAKLSEKWLKAPLPPASRLGRGGGHDLQTAVRRTAAVLGHPVPGADLHCCADGRLDRSPGSQSARPAPPRAPSVRHGSGGSSSSMSN